MEVPSRAKDVVSSWRPAPNMGWTATQAGKRRRLATRPPAIVRRVPYPGFVIAVRMKRDDRARNGKPASHGGVITTPHVLQHVRGRRQPAAPVAVRPSPLGLVLAVLMPAIGFGGFAAWEAVQARETGAEAQLRDTARALAATLDREVDRRLGIL